MEITNDERRNLIIRMKEARLKQKLSAQALSSILGMDHSSVSKWERGNWLPSEEAVKRITAWLTKKEETPKRQEIDLKLERASHQVEQLIYLLNAVEINLRYFTDWDVKSRTIFREGVDLYDVNYLISVLEALFDEGKFQRWKMFSNYKFQGFRRVSHGRKGKNQSQSRQSTQLHWPTLSEPA